MSRTVPWAGGHLSHHAVGAPGVRGLRVVELPYDDARLDVDLAALPEFLERERPALVVAVVERSSFGGAYADACIANARALAAAFAGVLIRGQDVREAVAAVRKRHRGLQWCLSPADLP